MAETEKIDAPETDPNLDQKAKEAYFTATQTQLIWARFKKSRSAMIAGAVLIVLITMGFLAPFLSPYDPTIAGRDKDYLFGAPQIPSFCDDNGCSARPFLYAVERHRGIETNFRWVTKSNKEKRRRLSAFSTCSTWLTTWNFRRMKS